MWKKKIRTDCTRSVWLYYISLLVFSPYLFAHPFCVHYRHQNNFFISYCISGLLKRFRNKSFEIKSKFLFDFYYQNSRCRTPKLMNSSLLSAAVEWFSIPLFPKWRMWCYARGNEILKNKNGVSSLPISLTKDVLRNLIVKPCKHGHCKIEFKTYVDLKYKIRGPKDVLTLLGIALQHLPLSPLIQGS